MHTRNRLVIGVVLVVMLVLGAGPAIAQQDNETYIVKAGDTVYNISIRFGTTVRAIAETNDLTNVDLIFVDQVIIIPGFRTSDPLPASAATATHVPHAASGAPGATGALADPPAGAAGLAPAGSWWAEVGSPLYAGDGFVVDIPITIHNIGVTPEIAGGKYTATQKPDGLFEDAALMKSLHGDFEQPLVGDALMWQANVHLSDGSTHFMTVGCEFIEHVFAEGDEPLSRDAEGNWLESFHYEINLYDGWFDCGNTLRVNPENIVPGTSGSSSLKVYLVNQHLRETTGELLGDPYPKRRVTQLDITVFRQDGSVVGNQSVVLP